MRCVVSEESSPKKIDTLTHSLLFIVSLKISDKGHPIDNTLQIIGHIFVR